ncbi:MAG: hypothetical protein ACREGR_00430, partial [Minisyncoccia bacterium]
LQRPWSTGIRPAANTTHAPERTINRYYDPATDLFLSIDPAVDVTGQPYVFTNDNPLNATDPLGLMISGTGSATCDLQENDSGVKAIECSGQTAGGQSALGVIFALPTATFSVGVGTVTLSQTISISGSYSVSFGNGGVTVSHGGATETLSSAGTASGSIGIPGIPGLALTDGGVAVSSTTHGHLGGDKVQVDTTATFYPESGTPPPIEISAGGAGASALGFFGWLGYQVWKACTSSAPELCTP